MNYIFPGPINSYNISAPFQNHWNLIHMPFIQWRKSKNAKSVKEEEERRKNWWGQGGSGSPYVSPVELVSTQEQSAPGWRRWGNNSWSLQCLRPGSSLWRGKRAGQVNTWRPVYKYLQIGKTGLQWTSAETFKGQMRGKCLANVNTLRYGNGERALAVFYPSSYPFTGNT